MKGKNLVTLVSFFIFVKVDGGSGGGVAETVLKCCVLVTQLFWGITGFVKTICLFTLVQKNITLLKLFTIVSFIGTSINHESPQREEGL